MLTVENAASIMAAVQLGQQLPINTPEALAMAEQLREEIAAFPPGVEVEIPGEWSIEEKPELMQEMRSAKRQRLREALIASSGYRLIESVMDSIMPGGADHWKGQPRAKDGKWIDSGVNHSKWAQNSDANYYKKKIKLLEKLVAKGEYEEFIKQQPIIKSKAPNTYQKGLAKAWQNLNEIVKQSMQAPPKGAVKVPGTVALAGWSKIGGSLGTEKGGTYIGPDGAKYYVKTPDNPARAHNEVLAFKLYELAGGSVVEAHLVQVEGKTGIATKWMNDAESLKWTAGDKVAASSDFALHAWLNNWDAIGAGSENPMDNIKLSEGNLKLVDAGGSLDYSGMGGSGKKMFTNEANEWDTLRDPKVNKTMAQVFGGMTDKQLVDSVSKLHNVGYNDIHEMVWEYHPGTGDEKNKMVDTLVDRRNSIIAKGLAIQSKLDKAAKAAGESGVDSMIAQAVGLKADEAPVIISSVASKGEPISPPPASFVASTKTKTLPPPPIITSPTNQGSQGKFIALYNAAKSGNIEALKAIKTNPSVINSYSKKTHAYKLQLLAAMQDGATANPEHVVPVSQPTADFGAAKASEKAAAASVAQADEMLKSDGKKVPKGLFSQPPTFQGSKTEVNNASAEKILQLARSSDKEGIQAVDVPDGTKIGEFKKKILSEIDQIPEKKAAYKKQKAEAQAAEAKAKVEQEKAAAEFQQKYGSDFFSASKALTKSTTVTKSVGWWNITHENIPVPHVDGNSMDSPELRVPLMAKGKASYDKAPAAVRKAIYDFTGSYSGDINDDMVSTKGKPKTKKAKDAARAVAKYSIDLPEGMQLRRNYTYYTEPGKHLVPGQVIHSDTIHSTSTGSAMEGRKTHMYITVGKGVKGLPAEHFSQVASEHEVVMGAGQRYVVTKYEPPDSSGKDRIYVLALPTGGVD
jgi:hypothetical protein